MHPGAVPGMHVWEFTAAHILPPDWGSESSHMLICYPGTGVLGAPVWSYGISRNRIPGDLYMLICYM